MGIKHLGSTAVMYTTQVYIQKKKKKAQNPLSIPFLSTKTVECFPRKQNESPNASSLNAI